MKIQKSLRLGKLFFKILFYLFYDTVTFAHPFPAKVDPPV
jgi:hypothetical protein